MDALSHVLAVNRVTGMVAMQLRARGSWGLATDRIDDCAFLVVAEGSCWLRVTGHPPVQLVRGDVLMLPDGAAAALTSSRNGRARRGRELLAQHPADENGVVDLGGSGPAVHLIHGEFTFEHDRPHPVLSQLPPLLHIPGAPATGGGLLSTVVHMLATELAQPRPGSDTVVAHLADILFVTSSGPGSARTISQARPGWARSATARSAPRSPGCTPIRTVRGPLSRSPPRLPCRGRRSRGASPGWSAKRRLPTSPGGG